MMQKYWIVIIVGGSVLIFLYNKFNNKELLRYNKLYFALGVILIFLGMVLVIPFYGFEILIEFILLHDVRVAGKFIPIGYMFIIISGLIYVDKIIQKFFNKK